MRYFFRDKFFQCQVSNWNYELGIGNERVLFGGCRGTFLHRYTPAVHEMCSEWMGLQLYGIQHNNHWGNVAISDHLLQGLLLDIVNGMN